jgi:hypothetical protein
MFVKEVEGAGELGDKETRRRGDTERREVLNQFSILNSQFPIPNSQFPIIDS